MVHGHRAGRMAWMGLQDKTWLVGVGGVSSTTEANDLSLGCAARL